jgi:ABC-type nitrate/sulfonate/bicarbonate transport system substrate-binding protein
MTNSITRKAYLAGAAALATAALPWPLAAQTPPVLKVGTGKIEPQAEAYYALDAGIFTRFGLNVDVETLTNAGITSSAVASGDLQIGATTCLNIAQARQHNLPFVGVVPGAVQFQHQSNGGLVVAPASPIATAKDLNGKSIAIETLNGLAELTIKAMVDQAGGDSPARISRTPHLPPTPVASVRLGIPTTRLVARTSRSCGLPRRIGLRRTKPRPVSLPTRSTPRASGR